MTSIKDYRTICKSLALILGTFFLVDYISAVFLAHSDPVLLLLFITVAKSIFLAVYMRLAGFSAVRTGVIPGSGPGATRGLAPSSERISPPALVFSLFQLAMCNILSSLLFRGGEGPLFSPAAGPFQVLILMMLMVAVVFFEELLYRFFLLEMLGRLGAHSYEAMLISGLLFSIGHIYLGLSGQVFAFVSSIVLSRLYYRSGGIRSGFIVHLTYNLVILKLYGYW